MLSFFFVVRAYSTTKTIGVGTVWALAPPIMTEVGLSPTNPN